METKGSKYEEYDEHFRPFFEKLVDQQPVTPSGLRDLWLDLVALAKKAGPPPSVIDGSLPKDLSSFFNAPEQDPLFATCRHSVYAISERLDETGGLLDDALKNDILALSRGAHLIGTRASRDLDVAECRKMLSEAETNLREGYRYALHHIMRTHLYQTACIRAWTDSSSMLEPDFQGILTYAMDWITAYTEIARCAFRIRSPLPTPTTTSCCPCCIL